jgi:hypothetical protein
MRKVAIMVIVSYSMEGYINGYNMAGNSKYSSPLPLAGNSNGAYPSGAPIGKK